MYMTIRLSASCQAQELPPFSERIYAESEQGHCHGRQHGKEAVPTSIDSAFVKHIESCFWHPVYTGQTMEIKQKRTHLMARPFH